MYTEERSTVVLAPFKPETLRQKLWRLRAEMILLLVLGSTPYVVVSCENSGSQPIVVVERVVTAPEG
jgi:hypothetical protein